MHQSYFMVIQIVNKTVKKRDSLTEEPTLVKTYNIDFMMTNVQFFHNRVLLSRTESFINQARINKVQNAQAEADFDDKIEKIR